MIHFISAPDRDVTVENVMGYVNNYINFNDLSNVENSSSAYSIHKEYGALMNLAEGINRGYSISAIRPNLTLAQGRFVKLKSFIKKIIGKCIRGYLSDITSQQTEFNANVTRFINQQMIVINHMNLELVRLREDNKRNNVMQETIPDEWYVDFENQFRGDDAIIKQRLADYVELFAEKDKVIDLGCGRGEFLELLKKAEIYAEGVDTNASMVQTCRDRGLEVSKQDCLEFLNNQKNESIGGIFASQVVEHLGKDKLYQLVSTAYKKLEKDGILVLETVNPLTMGVFCYGFYIDPTHTFPVHPAMLRFMAEEEGFEVEPVVFLNEFPEEYKFKTNASMAQEEVAIVDKLNEQMFGAQDYCLICRKR